MNGYSTRTIVPFRQEEHTLSVAAADLQELGLKVENTPKDKEHLALSEIPELTYDIDRPSQTIDLRVPWQRVDPKVIRVLQTRDGKNAPPVAGWGGVFNYDVFAEYVDTADEYLSFSGFGDVRAFSPYGVAYTTFSGSGGDVQSQFVRLDTAAVIDEPDSLTTWRLGDVITVGPTWSRSVRLGGAQFTRNRGLRPDIVSYPMPQLSGEVTVPSVMDVFVDGALRYSQQADPGPFVVDDLPVVTGHGEAQVVLRDTLGREIIQTVPFYVSTALLQKGLTDYGIEAGFVRQRYAEDSFDYGRWAVSGSVRHGLTNTLTLEGYGEAAGSLGMVSAGAYMQLGNLGVANASVAYSRHEGDDGYLTSFGIEHRGNFFTAGAQLIFTADDFADIGRVEGDIWPEQILRVNAGMPLGEYGSIGAAYSHVKEREQEDVSFLSATYSKNLFRQSYMTASVLHDMEQDNMSFTLSLSIPLGGGIDTSTTLRHQDKTWWLRQTAEDTPKDDEGFGWRVSAEAGEGDQERLNGTVLWDDTAVNAWAEASVARHYHGLRAGVTGSLATIGGGGIFLADRVDDSFVVIDSDGVPGVSVYQENRYLGKTDSRGLLFIDGLKSYTDNKLGLEPLDFPADVSLNEEPTRIIVPRGQSGLMVKFPVDKRQKKLLSLRRPDGTSVPLGAYVTGAAEKAVVGYDGQVYVTDIKEGTILDVSWPDGRCSAVISLPSSSLRPGQTFTCEATSP